MSTDTDVMLTALAAIRDRATTAGRVENRRFCWSCRLYEDQGWHTRKACMEGPRPHRDYLPACVLAAEALAKVAHELFVENFGTE